MMMTGFLESIYLIFFWMQIAWIDKFQFMDKKV